MTEPKEKKPLSTEHIRRASGADLDREVDNVERILDLQLGVNVSIGKLQLTFSELLNLMPGHILELDCKVDMPLELCVSGEKVVAKGEIVTIGENLALRVLEVVS